MVGIQGRELLLFKSYFAYRKQNVFAHIHNNSKSFVGDVIYGAPQGSGLDPLLFSIYLNDLKNIDLWGQLYTFTNDICVLYP